MKKRIEEYRDKIKTSGLCVVYDKKDIEALKIALNCKPKFKLMSIIFQSSNSSHKVGYGYQIKP